MTAADLSDDNLALLEAKLKADLETVQKVRALMREHLGGRMAAPVPGTAAMGKSGSGGVPYPARAPMDVRTRKRPVDVNTAVREVVGGLAGEFKIKHVKSALGAKGGGDFPDTSIRAVLMRMVQAGELSRLDHTIGRAGSTFARAGQPQEDPEA